MKELSIILMLVLAGGCLTHRRAIHKLDRIQDKHPALFAPDSVLVDSTRIDTLTMLDSFIINEETLDTAAVTALADIIENLSIENSRLKVELKTTPSIETNTRTWELSGTCKADTVYQEREVIIKQIIYQRSGGHPCEVVKGAPWWYYLLTALVGSALTFFSLKGRSTLDLLTRLFKSVKKP